MISRTAISALAVAAVQAASTDYKSNGANWGEDYPVCRTGKEQSPIDLKDASVNSEVSLYATNYYNFDATSYASTDRSWKVDFAAGDEQAAVTLALADFSGEMWNFTPAQFHFHAPSEHSVNGQLMDAEVHFVHIYKDEDTSVRYGAVIGVFFDKANGGASDNEFLTSFFEAIDSRNANGADNKKKVAAKKFIDSLDLKEIWSYDGSFTTPPCTEGIKWSVVKAVQPISDAQLKKFTAKLADNNLFAGGNGNNRVVQPLNDRTLWESKSGATSTVTYAAAVIAAISALAF